MLTTLNVCEDMGELDFLYITDRSTKEYVLPVGGRVCSSYKVKHTPSVYFPEISLLGIYKRNKSYAKT